MLDLATLPTLTLLAAIGRTPLLRLARIAPDLPPGVALFGKAEHLNPGGSLKDRPALAMIRAAEAAGRLGRDRAILDATSGNAGISCAMVGAALGHPVTLCLPADATEERKRILRGYGAEVVETEPGLGSDGARRRALELAQAAPDRYCHLDQYNNEANWRAHFDATAPEIWAQTGGQVTHFVAGLGTSGTFVGVARGLKARNPAVRAVAVQPDGPEHRLTGLKHMATAQVPGIWDPATADAQATATTTEGQAMARRLAREEGLLVGVSSGAVVAVALRLARELDPGAVVVAILADTGTRYLSESFWT